MTQTPVFPVPRTAVLWLLLTQMLALLLHANHMPVWLWAVAFFVVGWRLLTHAGRLSYPGRAVKALAVVAASAAVILAFERRLTLESAAAFLIAASLLKLLEMRVRRDGYVVGYLNFFLLGTGFLFDQSLLTGLYAVLAVWLLSTALVALHFTPDGQEGLRAVAIHRSRRAARLAASVMLVSLPMMLVLYLLFPRIGPLWSFTLQPGKAQTGLSEEMASGDIVDLSQSDALAFRVSFRGDELPPRQQLYWRALLLTEYDGRRWKRNRQGETVRWFDPVDAVMAGGVEYDIVLEATGENWLFSLQGVQALESGTGVTSDDLLMARRPVYQRLRYRAHSHPEQSVVMPLPADERQRTLQLPDGFNPASRALAQQLRQQHGNDVAVLQAMLSRFSREPFYYTLKPPPKGRDEVDDFLFNTRRGFCAHYAGALVFLARSAGIPARVVTGYQGGEWNDKERYLTVRQFDAHAWAEVWLPEQGWVPVDPTAEVAPDRIMYGLERAVADEGSFLQEQIFSAHRFRGVHWINRLRLQLDSMNYYWQRWVLSYDNQRQRNVLQTLFGLKEYQQALYGLGASFFVFFLLASAWLWWRQRPVPLSPFMRAWCRLQQRGARYGVVAMPGETAGQYCRRLALSCPDQAEALAALALELNQVLYQPQQDARLQRQREQQLLRSVHQMRRRLRRT